MKIGIITNFDYENYGNKLQNYALYKTLSKLFKTEKVYNVVYRLWEQVIVEKYFMNNNKLGKKRRKAFAEFVENSIQEIYIPTYRQLVKLSKEFDYFVVGSDQIWNPHFFYISSRAKFLSFCDKEKRVAYAPSFGVSTLPCHKIKSYKKGLKNFKPSHLSVREEAGGKIIKNLINEDVFVSVDPTLLLTKEEWLELVENSVKPKKKYLLTYFLSNDKAYNETISKIAKEHNLEIKRINNKKDKEIYTASPKEFINLINNASIVCTDSFHGCIFSILLEKPFINFKRDSAYFKQQQSRLDSLLKKTNLESRKIENLKEEDYFSNIDYKKVKEIIDLERKKSFKFLKNAIKNK